MLFSLWGELKTWMTANRKAETAERAERRDEALDGAAKAKTPEGAYDAQERIVNNSP